MQKKIRSVEIDRAKSSLEKQILAKDIQHVLYISSLLSAKIQ